MFVVRFEDEKVGSTTKPTSFAPFRLSTTTRRCTSSKFRTSRRHLFVAHQHHCCRTHSPRPRHDLTATLPPPRRHLAKELRSTRRSVNLSSSLRHHLLCSPNALDRRASHHRRRGTRLHHRASPPLSTPATITSRPRTVTVKWERRREIAPSLFLPDESKMKKGR
ncbi:hypothetical protein LR48_Vigan10g032200 [Vigna angularis]|uniref:Uncharacterized protein n=1 Tax=Phaseolus angularis TaxID=3914 RepID=A0A0L9VH85_PHAAN|nr:hypothetical protein LR48_Vigan10g032200 [Vigna angularis]